MWKLRIKVLESSAMSASHLPLYRSLATYLPGAPLKKPSPSIQKATLRDLQSMKHSCYTSLRKKTRTAQPATRSIRAAQSSGEVRKRQRERSSAAVNRGLQLFDLLKGR